MTKAKEKLIEQRRPQVEGMDKFICSIPNRAVLAGWDSITNGRTYPELAADNKLYEACCRYFTTIVNDVYWKLDGGDNE